MAESKRVDSSSVLWIFEIDYQDWFPFRMLYGTIEENKTYLRQKKIPYRHYEFSVSRNEVETIKIPTIEVYDGK